MKLSTPIRLLLPVPVLLAIFAVACRVGRSETESLVESDVRFITCAVCLLGVAVLGAAAIVKADK